MSDSKSQQEPTMEEILASIRRIISEDSEDVSNAVAPAAPPPAPAPRLQAVPTARPEPAPPPPPPPPMPSSRPAEDVLELTQMVTDDGSVVDVTKAELAQPSPSPPPKVEPREEPRPEPRPEPRMENNELLSANTASAASQSFAGLAGAVSSSRGVPLGSGQRTIEELVKEMLRPMLKQWLDANLPGLVQRIVEREVAKLAGRAEDSSRR